MRALRFSAADGVRFVDGQDTPKPGPNQALIRVLRAGICSTDLEITKGYVPGGFLLLPSPLPLPWMHEEAIIIILHTLHGTTLMGNTSRCPCRKCKAPFSGFAFAAQSAEAAP